MLRSLDHRKVKSLLEHSPGVLPLGLWLAVNPHCGVAPGRTLALYIGRDQSLADTLLSDTALIGQNVRAKARLKAVGMPVGIVRTRMPGSKHETTTWICFGDTNPPDCGPGNETRSLPSVPGVRTFEQVCSALATLQQTRDTWTDAMRVDDHR